MYVYLNRYASDTIAKIIQQQQNIIIIIKKKKQINIYEHARIGVLKEKPIKKSNMLKKVAPIGYLQCYSIPFCSVPVDSVNRPKIHKSLQI